MQNVKDVTHTDEDRQSVGGVHLHRRVRSPSSSISQQVLARLMMILLFMYGVGGVIQQGLNGVDIPFVLLTSVAALAVSAMLFFSLKDIDGPSLTGFRAVPSHPYWETNHPRGTVPTPMRTLDFDAEQEAVVASVQRLSEETIQDFFLTPDWLDQDERYTVMVHALKMYVAGTLEDSCPQQYEWVRIGLSTFSALEGRTHAILVELGLIDQRVDLSPSVTAGAGAGAGGHF